MARLTIKEAADKLGLPEQSLRSWAQSEKGCPFISIVCNKKSAYGRRTYYVCSERLEAYLQGKL